MLIAAVLLRHHRKAVTAAVAVASEGVHQVADSVVVEVVQVAVPVVDIEQL